MVAKKNSRKTANKKSDDNSNNDEVDYAATADLFLGSESCESDKGKQRTRKSSTEEISEEQSSETSSDEQNKHMDESNDKSGSEVDEEASSEEESDDAEELESSDDDQSEGNSDNEESENEGAEKSIRQQNITQSSMNGENCTLDLRNLLAINTHQINPAALYEKKSVNDREVITIPGINMELIPNEKLLLEKATSGCSQLISALWQLPFERCDAGPLVKLPAFDESRIPRSLPPPPPKKETKWEKFAKEKGISLNKEKRSRKVWDEATGTWMFRHGYQKANDDSKEWPIMEVKDKDDPFEDPWDRVRDSKRTRVDKNREQRMKNLERAGDLTKGSTNRLLKSALRTRNAGKVGGILDRENILPTGVPVDIGRAMDLKDKTTSGRGLKRGKESTVKALLATQRSTASLGKFDKMREGEPERKKSEMKALKKRKVSGNATDHSFITSEHERSMKLLKTVVEGGAKKEKDRKKGHLATGETAYDYDYDDGLGPSSFRKKKGRAGAGKLKKMTKKRVK